MKFITVGDRSVPAIGLGTYTINGSEAVDIIRTAIQLGYRHIDTAQLYENESEVGDALIQSGVPREEIYLVTKVWPSNLSKERFIPSVEESLQKLKTDFVDLLLIHWPHHVYAVEDYIHLLIEAKRTGLAKDIGVSNFNISQIKAALSAGSDIVTNQVEFHPWINQVRLRQKMSELNIRLTAYCPLAQGRMFHFKQLEVLAAKYLKSTAQILLRWIIQKDDILAIPRSIKPDRLEENLNVFDFNIDDDDMALMDAWKLENRRFVGAQNGAKWD